jgi:hypothetical protein
MQTLHRTQALQDINIKIELGNSKNKNKLATIDKQIQELENEITRIVNPNARLCKSDLSVAVSSLNSRIRSCGLSAYELWHRRCQFSKNEINTADKVFIDCQLEGRNTTNNRNRPSISSTTFQIGSIVYIIDEKTKHCRRPRYIVNNIDGVWLFVCKLTDNQLRSRVYKIHKNRCVKVPDIHISTPKQPPTELFVEDGDLSSTDTETTTPAPSNKPSIRTNVTHTPPAASRKSTRSRNPPERLGMCTYDDQMFDNDHPSILTNPLRAPLDTPNTNDTHEACIEDAVEDTNTLPSNVHHSPQPALRKSTRLRKHPDRFGAGSDQE